MATNSTSALTLADWAKRVDPRGKTVKIVELLSQTNEILEDATFMEANQALSHLTSVRTGLPAVAYRLMNAGTVPSKSTTAQINEGIGMLESYSQVDKKLAGLGGNVKAFRLSEARAFIEAMNQRQATTLIYGNGGSAPAEFTGLAPRYSLKSAGNGANIIDGGGTGGVNSSIWLSVWGENTVSCIFPKGSKAGLDHTNIGEVLIQNANGVTGALMEALVDKWTWDMGLALMDWRFCARIANIDIANLLAQVAGTAADLPTLMIKAMYRIPNIRLGKAVFYMNRTCAEFLDIERRGAVTSGGGLTYENVDGKRVMSFRGIPIKIVDAILETEARVV